MLQPTAFNNAGLTKYEDLNIGGGSFVTTQESKNQTENDPKNVTPDR